MKTVSGVGVWFLLLASVVAADEGPPVRGHVEDEKGQAVSGASVVAVDRNDHHIEATTDTQGDFQLPAVPEGQSFDVTITDSAKSRLWVQQVDYAGGKIRPKLNAVLTPPREVTVTVVDASGAPVKDALVLLQKSAAKVAAEKTGADGIVKLQVPMNPETTCIHALKSGAGYDSITSKYLGKNATPAFDQQIPQQLKLTLNGASTIRVKAIDSKGKPLAGINIWPEYVHRKNRPIGCSFPLVNPLQVKTGPDGIAVFDWLPPDIQGLGVHGSHDDYSEERADLSQSLPSVFGMRFNHKTKLAGKVMLPDRKPAPGIKLVATAQGLNGQILTFRATSDADGNYEMKVDPELPYFIHVEDEKWAGHIMAMTVREDKPAEGASLFLSPGTVITGQMVRGVKREPEVGMPISLQLSGQIYAALEDLQNPGRYSHRIIYFNWTVPTDEEGRYRFRMANGQFMLRGPTRLPPGNILINNNNQQQIVHDFYLPRADFVPLVGTVVDADGKPVADADVQGYYGGVNHQRSSFRTKSNAEGRFEVERETVPLIVGVMSQDKQLGRIVNLGEEKEEFRFELVPTATVRGRLIDSTRSPAVEQPINYFVRIYQGVENGPYVAAFHGNAMTDEYGLFEITGLTVGGTWSIGPIMIGFNKPGERDIGDIPLPEGSQSRPPIQQRLAQYFKPQDNPAERFAQAKKFAEGQSLRLMLIVGDPTSDVAGQFVQLLDTDISIKASLSDFEPLVLSTADKPAMELLKKDYDLDGEQLGPLSLVILDSDGKTRAIHNWTLANQDDKQPAQVMQEFVTPHCLPFTDANLLFDEALAHARRDDKRVLLMESTTDSVLCRPLVRLFDRHPEVFAANFVIVRIDSIRFENAQEVLQRYRRNPGSIPWCAVLDADGKKLADWDSPQGNILFPVQPREIEYFLKVLSQTAPKITPEQLADLRKDLEQLRKKPAK